MMDSEGHVRRKAAHVVTAKRIAKDLGLSQAAVSLALNQRPGVSDATRKRVIDYAKTLGYDFSRVQATIRRTKNVLLVRYIRSLHEDMPFFATLISAVEKALIPTEYKLVTMRIDAGGNVREQIREIRQLDCSGILLLATELRDEEWGYFEDLGLPIVVLDTYLPYASVDCVTINNWQGAYQATSALLRESRGCPGHIVAMVPLRNFNERADGFYSAVRSNGFSSSSVVTHRIGAYIDAGERDFSAVLESEGLTARCYFADNDQLALGAMRALISHGYRIPEDVSIIGFDDLDISRYAQPALSTVHVPKDYLGRTAVRRLMSVMEPGEWHPVRIEVGTSLVLRESTL